LYESSDDVKTLAPCIAVGFDMSAFDIGVEEALSCRTDTTTGETAIRIEGRNGSTVARVNQRLSSFFTPILLWYAALIRQWV
jgi:hypothetical protein